MNLSASQTASYESRRFLGLDRVSLRTPERALFAAVIRDTSKLLVPTVCLIEVILYITRAASRDIAQDAAAQMQRAAVISLDEDLAHLAARLSLKHNLPLADAIVYATSQAHKATLYT